MKILIGSLLLSILFVVSFLSLKDFYSSLGLLAAPTMFLPVVLIFFSLFIISNKFRDFVDNVSLITLTRYNLIRFVGFILLVAVYKEKLPPSWGIHTGIGDIIVASLASIALLLSRKGALNIKAIRLTHIMGIMDILFLIVSAIMHTLQGYEKIFFMTKFPMVMMPTFIIPLALLSHILALKIIYKGENNER